MNGKNFPKKSSLRAKSERRWGWFFVLPTVAGLLILNIIPMLHTAWQSFYKTGDFGKGNIFVGLKNYVRIFEDAAVWQALWNTIRYAIIEVPVSIAIALVLASLLNRQIRGRSVYRSLFFLPMVAAPAAVAMVWRWLYNTNFGLINNLLSKIGVAPISWLTDGRFSVPSIAVVGIWSSIGYNAILFLAGMQEIPLDYYEASEIDGAGSVLRFFKITIPLLSPTIYFTAITRTIAAMQVFDLIYMMIEATSPVIPKTQSLVYLFYKYAFEQYNRGYGATIVVLLLLVIMVITAIQQIVQKKWVHYE